MSNYTMLYKFGKRARDFWGVFFLFYFSFLCFGRVFNKTIIQLTLVGYEIIITSYPTLKEHRVTIRAVAEPLK